MDLLLSRYARKLLLKYRIGDLHHLSKVILKKRITDILRRGVRKHVASHPSAASSAASPALPSVAPLPQPASPASLFSFLSLSSLSSSSSTVNAPESPASATEKESTAEEEATAEEEKPKPMRDIINPNDFHSALLELHLQFNIPLPQRFSPSPHFTLLSSLHAGLGERRISWGTYPTALAFERR